MNNFDGFFMDDIPLENIYSLGNYENNRKEKFKKAISAYKKSGGELDVYIRDRAYINTMPAQRLDGYWSLITNDKNKCHSEFWKFMEKEGVK